tara:strand:+ start:3308 stop:3448 length:141 start_codon:yes stop_codon:yes gene_type:complete
MSVIDEELIDNINQEIVDSEEEEIISIHSDSEPELEQLPTQDVTLN